MVFSGGFKQANKHSKRFCNVCRSLLCHIWIDVVGGITPEIRDPKATRDLIRLLPTLSEAEAGALMEQEGLSRISPLWNIPGADLTRQMLFELMHLQAEGIICKHFLSFSTLLVALDVRPLPSSSPRHPSSQLLFFVSFITLIAGILEQALLRHKEVFFFPEREF